MQRLSHCLYGPCNLLLASCNWQQLTTRSKESAVLLGCAGRSTGGTTPRAGAGADADEWTQKSLGCLYRCTDDAPHNNGRCAGDQTKGIYSVGERLIGRAGLFHGPDNCPRVSITQAMASRIFANLLVVLYCYRAASGVILITTTCPKSTARLSGDWTECASNKWKGLIYTGRS